jgi:hypothetical protein
VATVCVRCVLSAHEILRAAAAPLAWSAYNEQS